MLLASMPAGRGAFMSRSGQQSCRQWVTRVHGQEIRILLLLLSNMYNLVRNEAPEEESPCQPESAFPHAFHYTKSRTRTLVLQGPCTLDLRYQPTNQHPLQYQSVYCITPTARCNAARLALVTRRANQVLSQGTAVCLHVRLSGISLLS